MQTPQMNEMIGHISLWIHYAIHFIAKLILSIETNKKNMTFFFTLAFKKNKSLINMILSETP